jgi:hypothetical protein
MSLGIDFLQHYSISGGAEKDIEEGRSSSWFASVPLELIHFLIIFFFKPLILTYKTGVEMHALLILILLLFLLVPLIFSGYKHG